MINVITSKIINIKLFFVRIGTKPENTFLSNME